MSQPVFIVITAKVLSGADDRFTAWKARHDLILGRFPGFIGADFIPAAKHGHEWRMILNFRSKEDLAAWRASPERAALVAEAAPILVGGSLLEIVSPERDGEGGDVTEVIFSKIKPGMEDAYREWAARMQAEQAKSPGYQGTFLQPPEEAGGFWTTIMRFDSAAHLERWMSSPRRKEMLREAEAFIEREQLTRLATSFPGWVPVDPVTGKGPPNWKTAMLVLLGLFPCVMLEMTYFGPIFASWNWPLSPSIFVSNVISVSVTSFVTMPFFIRRFHWWLFPQRDTSAATAKGVAILLILFAAEIALLWRLPRL